MKMIDVLRCTAVSIEDRAKLTWKMKVKGSKTGLEIVKIGQFLAEQHFVKFSTFFLWRKTAQIYSPWNKKYLCTVRLWFYVPEAPRNTEVALYLISYVPPGLNCETERNVCTQSNPCQNGATCEADPRTGTFRCLCSLGFSGATCGNRKKNVLKHWFLLFSLKDVRFAIHGFLLQGFYKVLKSLKFENWFLRP